MNNIKYIVEVPNDDYYSFRGFLSQDGTIVWETGSNPTLHLDKYACFISPDAAKSVAFSNVNCVRHGFSVLKWERGELTTAFSTHQKEVKSEFLQSLDEILRYAAESNGKVEAFLPQRIPLVDQALELANLMKETNPKQEVGELLSCAAKCFKQFSTPVYIIKEKND